MGTIVTFEQDPLRIRMRKKPKAVSGCGVVLPFSGEYKEPEENANLLAITEDTSRPLDAQRPA